ncbi:MAG: hypothetical protein CMN86_07730 [Stappia sp.]|nr:hypothetical protein [Stappia sp.]
MLNALLTLAKNPAPEARCRLLQRVADLFLDRVGQHTPAELELYCDIIMRLLDGSNAEERARLSRRMAPWEDTPNAIAYRLASDHIEIATPMLEMSPSLSERDLLKLARRMPQSHLVAMARRAEMPGRVADTLVEKGGTMVWRTIAGNTRCPLSDWALRTLAKRALSDAPLRDTISERHDLTPLICEWLIPHVNAHTRVRLEAVRAGTDPSDIVTPDRVRQELRQRHNVFLETSGVDDLWKLVEAGTYRLGAMILVVLLEGRVNDALQLIARAANTPVKTVQTAIFQAGVDELIALCLRADLGDQVFLALAHLRCRNLRLPESQATRWLEAFRKQRTAASAAAAARSAADPEAPAAN